MAKSQTDKAIGLLFQRPLEPVFVARDSGSTILEIPDEFFNDRYKPVGQVIQDRFNNDIENRVGINIISL